MTRRLLAPLGLAAVCALTCQPPPQARRPAAAQPAAFVTLFSGGDFLPGVQLLWYSLHRTSTAFPLLVMYTDEVDARALLAFARRVPGGTLETARVAAIANPYLRANSTNRYANVAAKLRVWQQRRYGVAVYIDADFLVLRSLDFLFEAVPNASLVGCPDARGRKAAAAAPRANINSGLLVLRPDAAVFERMMRAWGTTASYDHADQGFLNAFFGDAKVALPASYVAMRRAEATDPHAFNLSCSLCLHFGGEKPWRSPQEGPGGFERFHTPRSLGVFLSFARDFRREPWGDTLPPFYWDDHPP